MRSRFYAAAAISAFLGVSPSASAQEQVPAGELPPIVEGVSPWVNIPDAGDGKSHSREPDDTSEWKDIPTVKDASGVPSKSTVKEEADKWKKIPVVENETDDDEEKREDLSFAKIPQNGDCTLRNAQGDPHKHSDTWLMGEPSAQLQRDAQLRPVMGGGVFVPSMSGGLNEPKYQVYNEEDKMVKEAYTGATTYLSPGRYTVKVGTPVIHERLEFDVNVVEGSVTMIPAEWSGIVIKVVDDRGTSVRVNYEIVSLPDRGYIGLGTGALVNEGERLSTWLLWPGKYMIISAGEGYQARKNFITVDVSPGELSRVTLVVDEDTGDILGGGEVEEDIDDIEERWWWAGVLVGGSVKFNHTKDVVGKASGQLLNVSAFLETYFSLSLKKHYLYTRLNAEIGGTIRFEEDRPFITNIDELYFELLYSYRVVDWFGPYARFAFESNMAPSYQELTEPYTIERRDQSGNVVKTSENKLEVKLSPPFSPITVNVGAGGRFDYSVGSWFKMSARVGIAYRHVFTRDLFYVSKQDEDDNVVTIDPVYDSSQFGVEGALTFDLTPIRWFTLKVDCAMIEPFADYENPIVDLDVDAAIRLSSIASLSYTLRLNYDVSMIEEVQIDQYVQLRFSYKIY